MSVEATIIVAVLAVGAVLVVVRQMLYYPGRPGGWRYTFAWEHHEARLALRAARRRRSAVHRRHRQQVAAAEKKMKRVDKVHQDGIETLRRDRAALLWPHRGGFRGGLGRLHLYEHELVVLAEDPDTNADPEESDVVPLTSLTVRYAPVGGYSQIEITKRDGYAYAVEFPSRYDPSVVRDFQLTITNQIAWDREDWSRRRGEASRIDLQLRHAEAGQGRATRSARQELDSLIKAWPADPERSDADNAWERACDDWEALTGRRPAWWGRR